MPFPASIVRSAVSAPLMLSAALLITGAAGCRQQRVKPERSHEATPREEPTPAVGGGCSYEPLAFTAIVDSLSLPDRDVILHAIDSVPFRARNCHLLRDEGNGRWRLLASAAGKLAPGDTALVQGEVIRTGTCTPCSIGTRAATER